MTPAAREPPGGRWSPVTGAAAAARAWLTRLTGQLGDGDGWVWLRRQEEFPCYPKAECFLVPTVAGIEPKARRQFAAQWAHVCGQDTLFDLS